MCAPTLELPMSRSLRLDGCWLVEAMIESEIFGEVGITRSNCWSGK